MSATVARIAGISIILMAVAASLSYGYIHGSLVVEGDAAVTFGNLKSSPMLFRAEILGWVLIIACDIVAAWALYTVLKPVHPSLSMLGAWLRLSYTAVLAIAVSSLVVVSLLTDSKGQALSGFTSDQLQSGVVLFLRAFEAIWSVGLILFGGHLLIIGLLTFKSGNIPKMISVLLLLAAAGYFVIHLFRTLVPEYEDLIKVLEWVLMLPMTAGELGLGIWLLFRVPAPRIRDKSAS
ncbi:DUF4386 domain-containing protein [Paenibacillus donghaensis]|uniref:DUF4386 domain-containing protein n=1 Tax=Paenibacillus donghaensis TaxID=414771 RepID=A0A2Z2KEP6_9BACL|nr:DUF4386 domain-containing protein [Paenibacillus donghaensis]ASA20529.1 hypothetical protein B9T62_06760 [Paenibacillus donghaensis]